jgi:hypothetical protein
MKLFIVCVALCIASVMTYGGQASVPGEGVLVLERHGEVESAAAAGATWAPLAERAVLTENAVIRTGAHSTADLLLEYNGSVFRLAADSELRIEKLTRMDTGLGMVTETRLNVLRGNLVGAQRKLHKPSYLEIKTATGQAIIRGTEYVVNAQGAVSVLSGAVDVIYNLPGSGGSVKASVPAGFTFDPATGSVVPTTPEYLQGVIADVDAVRQNAEVFKTAGATIVVKPDQTVSPSVPNGNNGVGNGIDPQPPGNPPINDGPGTAPGSPGNQGGKK